MHEPVRLKPEKKSSGIRSANGSRSSFTSSSSILVLQRMIGNRATSQLLASGVIQRQLTEEQQQLVKSDLQSYYDLKQSDVLFKKDADVIAKRHNVDVEDLRKYYKNTFYKSLNVKTPTTVVNDGVLSIAAVTSSPFSGNSPTQSYLDTKYNYMGIYEKHLSVSYTLNEKKRTATITSIHVSFKVSDSDAIRFYWYVTSGAISRSSSFPVCSGDVNRTTGHLAALRTEALEMVNDRLGTIKCTGTP